MCRSDGMALCPYGVLNQGRLRTRKGVEEREVYNPNRKFIPTSDHDEKVSAILEDIANAKGAGLLNVAWAYVIQKTPSVFPIVEARKVEHIDSNIAGLFVALTEQDVEQVKKACLFDFGFPHTFLSGSMFDSSTPRMADEQAD